MKDIAFGIMAVILLGSLASAVIILPALGRVIPPWVEENYQKALIQHKFSVLSQEIKNCRKGE